tara:strand:- start:34 stop:1497 length:1464 start_codon:yes stop_codon:yes gene_type:complete
MDNETVINDGITLNSDIEELLSDNYSNKSNKQITINKTNTVNKKTTNIQEKLELSSNKDVDIGLELLVNSEKKVMEKEINIVKVPDDKNIKEAYNIRNDLDDVSRDANELENLLSNINLEENSSRLNQNEIDKLIDKDDRVESHLPNLVSKEDIEKELHNHIDENISEYSRDSSIAIRNHIPAPQYNRDRIDPQETKRKKHEILFKLEKMRRMGINGIKKFNMSSDLNDMECELIRVKGIRELESSVKFQRKCLMAFVTGTELVNNKFDFLDFKLDGWSENVHENINDYNEVFEELHEKYKEKIKMAPEMKLLFMLGGSAFMYHLTNSMFKNSIPGMEDIMKQNPALMKQFADAAINQMQGDEKQAAQVFQDYMVPNHQERQNNMNQQRGVNNSSSNMAPPDFNINTASYQSITSDNRDLLSNISNKNKVNTPFTNISSITPPTGVDDILDELRSNTMGIDEILSNSKSINIKSGKRRNNTIKLSLN